MNKTALSAAFVASAPFAIPTALAAGPDNDVEWDGVSHWAEFDRRPLVPMNRESFNVRFKAFADDLTAARVVYDGAMTGVANASRVGFDRGFDVWEATIPASPGDDVEYYFQLIDGSDLDYLGVTGVQEAVPTGAQRFGVDFADLSHAPRGATPVDGGTVFRVWAPGASTAHVIGPFNNAALTDPMTRLGEDFIAFVPGVGAGDEYKFAFDGSLAKPDARAKALNPSTGYGSIVVDPLAFEWTATDFVAPPAEQIVAYQLHVGSFAGRRDPVGSTQDPSHYRDIADRVQHFVDLGVNVVYLNPVNEWPGEKSGGYNPISAYAIESALAPSAADAYDDFKHMVNTFHENGIAVILDLVWNHFDSFQNFLWNYDGTQIYFDSPQEVETPWGPQADFNQPEVRDYFEDAALYLVEELRLDGFRFDAPMYMTYSNLTPQSFFGRRIIQHLNDTLDRRHVNGYSVAEYYDNATFNTQPTNIGGLGFDGQYHEAFKNAVRPAVLDAAFGTADLGRLASSLDGTGGAVRTTAWNYFELHDDAWTLNGTLRAVRAIDTTPPHDDAFAKGRSKVGNAVTLLSQGVPAILQGTEVLEDESWEDRRYDWFHRGRYDEIFDFYADLIALRTTRDALFADADTRVIQVNDFAEILAFERSRPGGESFVVVINLSNTNFDEYVIGMPRAGQWGAIMNSDARRYDGLGFGTAGRVNTDPVARDGFAQSARLAIPANGVLLLQHNPSFINCGPADLADPLGQLTFADVGAFLDAYTNSFAILEPGADLATPFGEFTFGDISAFLNAFAAGCP
jgi:1,4-alpha-glucan branching enzyme